MERRKAVSWQRQQRLSFDFLKLFANLLFRCPVDPRIGNVRFPFQEMIVLVNQSLEEMPLECIVLHVLDATFNLPLVLWRVRFRRNKHRPVVTCERLKLWMNFGIVPVGSLHRGLQVVDHQSFRTPPK